jgi:hypothetical protein
MAHAPGQEDQSQDHAAGGFTRERLPTSPGPGESHWAGYDTASSPEVILRHARLVTARDKRARHVAVQTAGRLSRDELMARIWHGASLGEPWVTPAVREHFACCVAACLANEHISRHLADRRTGWSRPSLEASPIVRVEFEQALVLGRLGESLCAARHKAWGVLLGARPLEARDPVHPSRIVYAFKAAAPYQRRFEQRLRLRPMLGKEYAPLVPRAMGSGKAEFLASLSEDEAARVRARTGLEPGRFWHAAKGRELIRWPESPRQLTLFDVD